MDYRPIGHLNETIVTGAELEAESSIRLMSLVEQKKAVEEEIQTERENAFFQGDSVLDIGIDDVDTSSVPDRDLEDLMSINNGKWRTIIEECYSFRESRDPERPLSRIEAVSEQVSLPISDVNTMIFDTGNVKVTESDGEEIVEIEINDSESITLFVQKDDMEYYQGMYVPPVTHEISSLKEYVSSFDKLTIRNHSEKAQEVLNHHKPETVDRDIKKTEIVLSHDLDKKTYLPKELYEMDEDSKLAEDVSKMRSMVPLPNEKTREFLFRTLQQGYFFTEVRSKLFRMIKGDESIVLKYSHASSPEYIDQFCQLAGINPVSIPQEDVILLTRKQIPDWIRRFNAEFPEKNSLTESERERLYDFINYPEFVDPISDWTETIRAKEILLELYENDMINQDEIVSYYANPWDEVKPTEKSVMEAIRYGNNLREQMSETDEKYGTDLIDAIIKWEKRSIYRRSDYPKD